MVDFSVSCKPSDFDKENVLAFCCMNCCLHRRSHVCHMDMKSVLVSSKLRPSKKATATKSSNTPQGQIYKGNLFTACEFQVIKGVPFPAPLPPFKRNKPEARHPISNCTDAPFNKHVPPNLCWEKPSFPTTIPGGFSFNIGRFCLRNFHTAVKVR